MTLQGDQKISECGEWKARHEFMVKNMRDSDIRIALYRLIEGQHAMGCGDTLLLDEMGVAGTARVDVAVLNGSMVGYEIKSDVDKLGRLPKQIIAYDDVLDRSSLVVTERHFERSLNLLPPHWGIIVASASGEDIILSTYRCAKTNPDVTSYGLARMLWREEALEELHKRGADRGVRSKPRSAVWARLAESVEFDELRTIVLERLKERPEWIARGTLVPNGVM